eukprot:m51a1_g11608 hypothetical protein (440) ;mRNA; f:6005-8927
MRARDRDRRSGSDRERQRELSEQEQGRRQAYKRWVQGAHAKASRWAPQCIQRMAGKQGPARQVAFDHEMKWDLQQQVGAPDDAWTDDARRRARALAEEFERKARAAPPPDPRVASLVVLQHHRATISDEGRRALGDIVASRDPDSPVTLHDLVRVLGNPRAREPDIVKCARTVVMVDAAVVSGPALQMKASRKKRLAERQRREKKREQARAYRQAYTAWAQKARARASEWAPQSLERLAGRSGRAWRAGFDNEVWPDLQRLLGDPVGNWEFNARRRARLLLEEIERKARRAPPPDDDRVASLIVLERSRACAEERMHRELASLCDERPLASPLPVQGLVRVLGSLRSPREPGELLEFARRTAAVDAVVVSGPALELRMNVEQRDFEDALAAEDVAAVPEGSSDDDEGGEGSDDDEGTQGSPTSAADSSTSTADSDSDSD